VRLRVSLIGISLDDVEIFQFLLVRLRERLFRLRLRDFQISIPSGAIKSLSSISHNGGEKKFQFLLVRLRAYTGAPPSGVTHISIPSGAIKRNMKLIIRGLLYYISIPSGAIKRNWGLCFLLQLF